MSPLRKAQLSAFVKSVSNMSKKLQVKVVCVTHSDWVGQVTRPFPPSLTPQAQVIYQHRYNCTLPEFKYGYVHKVSGQNYKGTKE